MLGEEFEKVLWNPAAVCGRIKVALKEEISEKFISARTIESYCCPRWKKRTRPIKNEKPSFLNNTIYTNYGKARMDNQSTQRVGNALKHINGIWEFDAAIPYSELLACVAEISSKTGSNPVRLLFHIKLDTQEGGGGSIAFSGASTEEKDFVSCNFF